MWQDHDLINDNQESASDDPIEAKLDYWREDTLLHAFHTNFHKIEAWLTEFSNFSRTYELFAYTHQQMLRRYNTTS